MKAPPFAYVRASKLDDVFALLAEHGDDARVMAGGQSLLAGLAFRLSEPKVVVDISRLADLKGITLSGGRLRIGALTTHASLGRDEQVRKHVPLFAQAVPLIAHAAIRNRGTLGGSLAYADPAAELPACLVALGGDVFIASRGGERRVAAEAFFKGLYATALGSDEVIAAVDVPIAGPTDRSTIVEIARRSGDYAMAGVAIVAQMANERLSKARAVFFGVGDAPVLAKRASEALEGRDGDDRGLDDAVLALAADLDPPADAHGGPDMKRHLAGVLLRRAVAELLNTPRADLT